LMLMTVGVTFGETAGGAGLAVIAVRTFFHENTFLLKLQCCQHDAQGAWLIISIRAIKKQT
jgi:hypothetical protein